MGWEMVAHRWQGAGPRLGVAKAQKAPWGHVYRDISQESFRFPPASWWCWGREGVSRPRLPPGGCCLASLSVSGEKSP